MRLGLAILVTCCATRPDQSRIARVLARTKSRLGLILSLSDLSRAKGDTNILGTFSVTLHRLQPQASTRKFKLGEGGVCTRRRRLHHALMHEPCPGVGDGYCNEK